jgi:hypothetical protein
MKNLILFLIALTLLASCKKEEGIIPEVKLISASSQDWKRCIEPVVQRGTIYKLKLLSKQEIIIKELHVDEHLFKTLSVFKNNDTLIIEVCHSATEWNYCDEIYEGAAKLEYSINCEDKYMQIDSINKLEELTSNDLKNGNTY